MLIRNKGGTWESPGVTSYTNEDALERLLLETPELLPGAGDSTLAVVRQLYVPETGPVDLFAIEPSGVMTIVECKLRTNREIRREVVGQVLAYASGLWRLSYADLDAAYSARADVSLTESVSERALAAGLEFDEELFRRDVASNLEAGRFRLVIAVDDITDELKRVIEYLNLHTVADVEVLALELGYVAHGEVEILVPQVYGVETVRQKTTGRRSWTEDDILRGIDGSCSPEIAATIREIYGKAWDLPGRWEFFYGTGQHPSVNAWFRIGDIETSVFSIYTKPTKTVLAINFGAMRARGVPVEALALLADQLGALPHAESAFADLEAGGYSKYPSLGPETLAASNASEVILAALAKLLDTTPS